MPPRRDRPSPDPTPGKGGPSPSAAPLTTAAAWSRWLLLGTALAAGGAAVPAPVALAVAGLGFVGGVPHGAVDHVIAARLADRPIGLVAAVYAGVAAAAWALLQWADPLALILAVALSALHFGLGELDVVHRVAGWRPPPGLALPIVVAGSGALLLPLARCGDQLRAVATTISPALASLIGSVPVQTGLVVVWLLAALVAVAGALRAGHPAVAVDILIVGAVGVLAPPLVAFAVWFGGCHALRHGARILTVEPGCAALLTAARTRAAVLRLVRLAAVPTLAAWATLAALTWCTVTAPDPNVMMAQVLRLLLALTVPHALVVLWLDRVAARRTTPAVAG